MTQTSSSSSSSSLTRLSSEHSSLPHLLILLLIAAFAVFWRLGAGSLAAWDEAIYAEVSKEMARGGGWLTPHWEYQPWFEKPPLLIWMTALFFRLFGVSEFWARAASAFAGLGLVLITYWTGKLAYDSRVGFFASLILLTGYHFLSFARFGTMDMLLTFFLFLAIYSYLRLSVGQERWWYPVCASCALAVMAKGAGGLVAPAVILLALLLDRRLRMAIASREFRLGILLALLIAAPWHILMYAWYGRAFTAEYIGYHVVARSTRTLEGNPSTYFYYLGKLIDGFFPWCLLAPFALLAAFKEHRKGETRSRVFLITSVLVFTFYTLIPTRRPWYIIPLYPALAILVAAFLLGLYRTFRTRPLSRRIIASVCVALIVFGALYSIVSLLLNGGAHADPLAQLARAAQSTNPGDRDPLLLFSESTPFYEQVPMFYSDRPIQQTYSTNRPESEDAERYVHFEKLDEVLRDSTKPIIIRKSELERLNENYEIQLMAEADPLVYAAIKRKR